MRASAPPWPHGMPASQPRAVGNVSRGWLVALALWRWPLLFFTLLPIKERAMATYNGHKNYNRWNVSLWIANDEGLYNLARDCIRRHRTRDDSVSAIRAAMVGM